MPAAEDEFLYSPGAEVRGEVAAVLQAIGISSDGRDKEKVLAEVQRKGVFLAHLLDCPEDAGESESNVMALTEKRLPQVMVRIRRSIKPQKVVVLRGVPDSIVKELREAGLGESAVLQGISAL